MARYLESNQFLFVNLARICRHITIACNGILTRAQNMGSAHNLHPHQNPLMLVLEVLAKFVERALIV